LQLLTTYLLCAEQWSIFVVVCRIRELRVISNQHFMINPFELLGLEANSCTLLDLRKAYFNLALFCHPDKGGSANDMMHLQSAYMWVKEQLEIVQTMSKLSHNDVDQLYSEYKNAFPMSKVPNFINVASEALNYNKSDFVALCMTEEVPKQWIDQLYEAILLRLYVHMHIDKDGGLAIPDELSRTLWDVVRKEIREQCANWHSNSNTFDVGESSIPHGYGEVMDKFPALDIEQPITHSFGKRDVTLYEEPIHATIDPILLQAICSPKQLDDYSVFRNCEPSMYDYTKAFEEAETITCNYSETCLTCEETTELLKQLQNQRQDQKLIDY